MIYIDQEKKVDFTKELAILSEKFPQSFTKKGAIRGGTPIRIEFAKKMPKVAVYKAGKTDDPMGLRAVKPAAQKVSAGGTITIDGISRAWIHTRQAPKIQGNEKVFKKSFFDVSVPKLLDPEKDFETIVCLYFYSPAFANNYRNAERGKGQNAQFKFVFPAEESKRRINEIQFLSKYSGILLNEETRITDEQLVELMEIMGQNSTGVFEDDRLGLYESVTKVDKFRERFEKVYEIVKGNSQKVKEVMDTMKLIKTANAQNILVEEENFWVIKNANGTTVRQVTEVRGTKIGEKREALSEFLKISPSDVEMIESYLD